MVTLYIYCELEQFNNFVMSVEVSWILCLHSCCEMVTVARDVKSLVPMDQIYGHINRTLVRGKSSRLCCSTINWADGLELKDI